VGKKTGVTTKKGKFIVFGEDLVLCQISIMKCIVTIKGEAESEEHKVDGGKYSFIIAQMVERERESGKGTRS